MNRFLRFLPLFIFVAAFLIRIWGTHPGYPDNHPDEGTSYQSAIYMLYHYLNPSRFDYPAGLPLVHMLAYLIFILPFILIKLFLTHPIYIFELIGQKRNFFLIHQADIFGPHNIYALYWSRNISAVIGTLAVVLVYFAGKKIFNKRVGIFASLFLAFNFRHVLGSHFGLPDVLNSFLSLLSLFMSFRLLSNPNRKNYILAGIAAVLGFSIKYQPFAYLPFFAAHLLLAVRKKNPLYLFNINFILAFLGSLAVFFLINPYYPANIGEAIKQNSSDYHRYQMGHFAFRPYPFFYLFHFGIGEIVALAAAAGIILMIFLKFQNAVLLSSYALVFLFVMTIYSNGGVYPRNFVSVMPYLMLFAGFFADFLYLSFKRLKIPFPGILIGIGVIIGIFSSVKNIITLDYNYSKPWNMTLAKSWIENKIPNGSSIRVYPIFFPIEPSGKTIIQKDWNYQKGPNSLSEFQEEGTDFAVLNTEPFQGITYWWRGWDDPKRLFSYNTIPFDYIQNNFFGLSVKELMRYSVYQVYKPWQAQDEYNYLVFKIPNKIKNTGNKIQEFNFDNNIQGWKSLNPFHFSPLVGGWTSKEGKKSLGSVFIDTGGDTTQRLVSPAIKIIPGKLYTVRAQIKPGESKDTGDNPVDRDGFIRLDMFAGGASMDGLGEAVAISSRAFKLDNWQEEQASILAPLDAQYMTISFQREKFTDGPIYFDDVEVYQGEDFPSEPHKELPYIKPTIPLESIYYNSFI